MSKIYVDTDKLEEDSELIKGYVKKLEELLDSYMKQILRINQPEVNIWRGNSADKFLEIIKEDYKNEYTKVLQRIRLFATELYVAADEYKSVVKNQVL